MHMRAFVAINLPDPVRDALARVQGVGNAEVLTDFQYAMRLWMDADRSSAVRCQKG